MPEEPGHFVRQMNRLCIEMTNTRRKADGQKARKGLLRCQRRDETREDSAV